MPYHNISATIDVATFQDIKNSVERIKNALPFLVNMTKKERNVGKLNHDKLAFLKAAYDYATNNPNLIPATLPMDEWEKDIKLLEQLTLLLQEVNVLQEAISDTNIALRIETQIAAKQFYKYAQIAAKGQTPGIDIIVDDLKKKLK
jgi:hypothetical protein